MRKFITYELDQDDLRLVNTVYNRVHEMGGDPCKKCSMAKDGSCCGCPDGREYASLMQSLEDNDLKSLYQTIVRLEQLAPLVEEYNDTIELMAITYAKDYDDIRKMFKIGARV